MSAALRRQRGGAAGAGWPRALLGWRPDEFWDATPAELAAVAGRTPSGGAAAPRPARRSRRLMERVSRWMRKSTALVVDVRADTAGFARDVATMRGTLDGPLVDGVDAAGRRCSNAACSRRCAPASWGSRICKRVALPVLDDIAAQAVQARLRPLLGGGASVAAGWRSARRRCSARCSACRAARPAGRSRRAAPIVVGERGPELFVPTSAGGSKPAARRGGARRAGGDQPSMRRAATSGRRRCSARRRQVARAVSRALAQS